MCLPDFAGPVFPAAGMLFLKESVWLPDFVRWGSTFLRETVFSAAGMLFPKGTVRQKTCHHAQGHDPEITLCDFAPGPNVDQENLFQAGYPHLGLQKERWR